MKYSTVLFLVFTFLSHFSYAESKDMAVNLQKPSGVLADSSEANRKNKSYFLAGELGYAVAPIPSIGVNGGYYVNSNSMIQLQASYGVFPLLFVNVYTTTYEMNYKHFFGNSFYLKSGVAYRKIDLKNVDSSTLSATTDIGSVETLAADFAIGNQWQWQNFSLGCDWIGAMFPVATLSKNYDTTGITGQDLTDLNDAWDKLATVTTIQFLRFYLGASF